MELYGNSIEELQTELQFRRGQFQELRRQNLTIKIKFLGAAFKFLNFYKEI